MALSTMEGTNGNYEPMNGRLGVSLGAFGSGTFPEGLVDPQMPDADFGAYACVRGVATVIRALDGVEKLCAAMIKKYRTPDGPGSSQSAASQCSTEKTATNGLLAAVSLCSTEKMATKNSPLSPVSLCSTERMATNNPPLSPVSLCCIENVATTSPPLATGAAKSAEKKREKFSTPVDTPYFIDLSEDSCDTGISRRLDQDEPEDAGQLESSPLGMSMAPIELSDSDEECEEDVNEKEECLGLSQATNPAPEAQVATKSASEGMVDGSGDYLTGVFKIMQDALDHNGAVQRVALESFPTHGRQNDTSNKRQNCGSGDDVSFKVNSTYQSSPWATNANELMQAESVSVPRPKRGRGRPRKEDSTQKIDPPQVGRMNSLEPRDLLESTDFLEPRVFLEPRDSIEEPRDLLESIGWKVDTIQKQVAVAKANVNRVKEKNAGKGEEGRNIQLETKGKRKVDVEDLLEDEVDEEEECRKPAVFDLAEELIQHASKLKKEKVDYEPYVRRRDEEDEDELEDIFMEMKTRQTSNWGSSSDIRTESCGKDDGVCDHKNFDFEDGLGYYCEDCGTEGIEMPTSKSSQQNKNGCLHRNYEFTDEAGIFCPDCGKVFRDIQSYYVASETPKALRKQGQKLQDTADGLPRVQLNLQGSSTIVDFCGADLQLHPRFEEKLHLHQKKGFKFLTEHLLGGQPPNNEAMGCVMAHAPGTGKTCLVISFIQSFLCKFPSGKPLILAPKIMLQTWMNEFAHWKVQELMIYRLGASTCGNVHGDGGFEEDDEEDDTRLAPQTRNTWKEDRALKLREWQASRGVLLMSYKLFTNLVMNGLGENVLPESLDYQMSKVLLEATNLVILDEGHLARNDNAQITKALHAMKTKRKVVLSGTLFHNTFKELYTVLKLCRDDFMITHPYYGKRIAELAACDKRNSSVACLRMKSDKELMQIEQRVFTEEIGEKLERYVKDASNIDEILPVVQKFQSLTRFVDWYPGGILKDLPGLYEYTVYLNLTEFQTETIRLIPSHVNHMARQCQILSACIHPSLVSVGSAPFAELTVGGSSLGKEAHKGVKITFLLRLITLCATAKEKLLIFCATLEPLRYVEELFCHVLGWQSGKQILRLDGKMQDSDRQRVIVEFNNIPSPSQVLLASTKACKEGITLVGASRVVVLDCPDNPSVVRQAVSRAFRIGQKKKVYVYRLVTSNLEETNIFKRSVNKECLSQVLSDPASTIGKLRGFLEEQGAADVEDQLLKKMITDREMAKNINTVYRYNAIG